MPKTKTPQPQVPPTDTGTAAIDAPSAIDEVPFGGSPPCPICQRGSDPCFTAGAHHFYRCVQCRTAFVHPQPSPEALYAFYDLYHKTAAEGGWYDEVEDRMQQDFPWRIEFIQRITGRKPGRLLDVGCGKGFFVKACLDAGIDAEGIDLSESGVQYAVDELGVKATAGRLEHHRDIGRFNTVTFWATVEHLADPKGMLEAIGDVLEPGGYLFLDTGIGDDWLDRLLPGHVQWYDPPQHLFVFSADGMHRLVESSGFEMLELDPSFERSPARKLVKYIRNWSVAAGLRLVAEAGRLRGGKFGFTRYPIGNAMAVAARKK